jgi:hypothetical protein
LRRGARDAIVADMRIVWVVLSVWAVLASGCLLAGPFSGGKTPIQAQHQRLGELFPARIAPASSWKGEPRVAKLRVWADSEYRAQNVQWQHAFEGQLDYANQVLVPLLGVRLEAEYRAWEHHAPGGTLFDHAAALAKEDPGEDVVWVVGLTSALGLVAATFDVLGVARLGGRHVVLRGYADLEERRAFERAFPDVDEAERKNVLDARRQHKTAAVLLHELAHSLGALHELAAASILSPTYSHRATSLDEHNRALMQIVLEDRLAPPDRRDPRAVAQKLVAALEVEWGGWAADERAGELERLRAELAAGAAGSPAAPAAPGAPGGGIAGPVPGAAAGQYRHAQELLAGGDLAGAQAALEPLLAAYPAHAELRLLGCKIELARGGVKDPKAIAACERAIQLAPGVEPAIAFAQARLAAGDAAGGRATLAAAEARLASLAPEQAAPAWLVLAAQYRAMQAVTWTEAALAKAGAAGGPEHPLARWAAMTRVRYGIPRDGARWKLAAADDAAALAAVRGLLDLVYADKLAAASQAAAAAEQRWPALPGLLAARCDLELRRGAPGAARSLCARGAEGGRSSWASYLLGVLELRGGSPAATAAGIKRLREAIALDPELAQAWRTLAKALDRAKDRAALDQLRAEYQARFGGPLP